MGSRLSRDPAARDPAEDLLDSLRFGRKVVFQNHLTRLIQNAVMAETISQVQNDGQFVLLLNLVSVSRYGGILFHKLVSFVMRLERLNRWERIASRRRPAFSSRLMKGASSTGRRNTI
jgi:hypothetical protein